MKKILVSLTLIAGLLTGLAKAETEKPGEFKFFKTRSAYEEKKLEILKRELDLSNAQLEKVREIEMEKREAIERFVKEHRIPIKEALKLGKFDRNVFVKTVRENAEKIANIKADHIEKILEILNEKQKEKFLQMMERRIERMHQRMKDEF